MIRPIPPRGPTGARFLSFSALSLALHATAFVVLGRRPQAWTPTFDATSQALTGDTLELDTHVLVASTPLAPGESRASRAEDPGSPPVARARHDATKASTEHAARRPPSSSAPSQPALFGAVGARSATDLATAFTRAFPQAASADAHWSSVPWGPAGTVDVTLVLDEAGSLVHSTISPTSTTLGQGVARTLALLGPRAFTAHGAVTRLRVVAQVTRDGVHDDLHGEVFALSGGSFAGEVGTAFFALPSIGGGPGRRVDIGVRLTGSQ